MIIPFLTPLILAIISSYAAEMKSLPWLIASASGLASAYLSTLIGSAVYGYSVGWSYVTDDMESKAVFIATLGIQTITFFVVLGISMMVVKRYNKSLQPDASKAGAAE